MLGHLGRLETLNLRRSGIVNLPEDAFDKNEWLRRLTLAENNLRNLDVATTLDHNLQHLDYLDLSDCRLTGPLSEDAFTSATKLRTLLFVVRCRLICCSCSSHPLACAVAEKL